MDQKRPKALFVGPAKVGAALASMRPEWEFIEEVLPNGTTRPVQDLMQLQEGFNYGTIDNVVEVIFIIDTLFDPNDVNGLFENAIANFSPHCLTGVVSYFPEKQNIIRDKVSAKQAELDLDGNFYFINYKSPNPSIDSAVERFVKESGLREISEKLLGRPLEHRLEDEVTVDGDNSISIYDEAAPGQGEILVVTSNKGGSGKTTIALSLATYLAHASQQAVREGLEDRPLKIMVVDFDVHDGQVGFLIGKNNPTMLDLIQANPLTTEAIKNVTIHQERLGLDILLAPKLPEYADDLSLNFYRELLKLLRREYDYIIVDTSVNYLDPLLKKVAYPESDAIIFVCDYIIQSLFGMHRWLISMNSANRPQSGPEYIDPSKIGIVVNKTLQNTALDKEMLLKATMNTPILTTVPANPRVVGHASNQQTMDMLIQHPDFSKRFKLLAEKILDGSYTLPKVLQS